MLKGGLSTVTDDLGNVLEVYIANEANESHYETTPMLVNVRAKQFQFGSPNVYKENTTTFISDHHQNNKNLPAIIDEKLTEVMELPENIHLKKKLKKCNVTIQQCLVNHAEYPLHGEIRWDKAMRNDGLTASKHKDYTLLNRDVARIYTSIIYGDFFIKDAEKMSALQWFKVHRQEIITKDAHFFWVIHEILLVYGSSNLAIRNNKIKAIKLDYRYANTFCLFCSWRDNVRKSGHCQFIGRYINSYGITYTIGRMIRYFEELIETVIFAKVSSTQAVTDIILRFYGGDISGFSYDPFLQNNNLYLRHKFENICSTYSCLICESRPGRKPLLKYTNTSKIAKISTQESNIQGMVNNTNKSTMGNNGNTDNERYHRNINRKKDGVVNDKSI